MSDVRCRECGGVHHAALDESRCRYLVDLRAELFAYAATLNRPASQAAVHDLWAHSQTIHEDGAVATRWVRRVLELGWRPVVGADQ